MASESVATEQFLQYLGFRVAGEEYAVGLRSVKELVRFSTVTHVPSVPPYIRGVTNLRGKVVPVVDLAVRFGLAPSPITKWSCIVMVEVKVQDESSVVGLLADSVSQLIELPPSEIEAPPSFGTRAAPGFLEGMGRSGQKFVLLLHLDRVLNEDDLGAASHAAAQAEEEPANEDSEAAASPKSP